MKSYWEIPGPSKAPKENCIAFEKLDGSNIRCEWSKKRGWYKFGSRNQLLDSSHPLLGSAPQIFLDTYGDDLSEVFKKEKVFRGVDSFTVFCEFFGKDSFAGLHYDGDPKQVVLFDVNANKKGFVLPRDFVNIFGHLKIPKVLYEGKFNTEFVQDVMNGKYGYEKCEGVVAKGVLPSKNPQHSLWMAKVKTKWWIDELKNKAEYDERLRKIYQDNQIEQKVE